MGPFIIIWILGLLFFAVGIVLCCRSNNSEGKILASFFLIFFGLFFLSLVTFVAIPQELPRGLPKTSINIGEYKVAFVYVAGENVSIGIEWEGNENERLYLYQFPKSAFDSGSMNTRAKKLVVVESRNFKKLVLE